MVTMLSIIRYRTSTWITVTNGKPDSLHKYFTVHMIYEKLHTTSHGSHAEPILIRSSIPRVLRRPRLTISIYSSELQVMLPYHNLDLDVECYHFSDLTTYIMKTRTFMIDGWCSSIDRSSWLNFTQWHWPRYACHHLDWVWRWDDCRCVIVPSVKRSEFPLSCGHLAFKAVQWPPTPII